MSSMEDGSTPIEKVLPALEDSFIENRVPNLILTGRGTHKSNR